MSARELRPGSKKGWIEFKCHECGVSFESASPVAVECMYKMHKCDCDKRIGEGCPTCNEKPTGDLEWMPEKPQLELVPLELLEDAARAFESGIYVSGYKPNNWQAAKSLAQYMGATLRHLFAWFWKGTPDKRSGLDHWCHVAACVAMISWIRKHKPEADDRPFVIGIQEKDCKPRTGGIDNEGGKA